MQERRYAFDPAGWPKPEGVPGRVVLERIRDGDLPHAPMHATLQFRIVEVAEGEVTVAGEPGLFAYNPHGVVHGGWASALLDSAMGCAVLSALPAGVAYTTTELSVRLVRAITADSGEMRCVAQTLHVGRRLATASGRVLDRDGRLYAHGETSCLVLGRAGEA